MINLNQEREKLVAEIEQFKVEAMKCHVVECWAASYENSNPFGYIIDKDGQVFFMKEQARQLWQFWSANKQQAEITDLKQQLVHLEAEKSNFSDQVSNLLDERQDLYKNLNEQDDHVKQLEKLQSDEFVLVKKSELMNITFSIRSNNIGEHQKDDIESNVCEIEAMIEAAQENGDE